MITVHPIPALKDNYIWAVVDDKSKTAVIIDPGEAAPVHEFLRKNGLTPKLVLLTHHHWDHTNGAAELCDTYKIQALGKGLQEGSFVETDGFPLRFKVIQIPGHTLDHIALHTNEGHLFCGDTLFSIGCGRVFEGTMEQMFNSLQKLAALPDETRVYCGHEYTQNNLRFAQAVEPGNAAVVKKQKEVDDLRANNQVTLPSTIKQEKAANPFLRCQDPEVMAAAEKYAGHKLNNPVEVFTAIRKWKDSF